MTRAVVILNHRGALDQAHNWIERAPVGTTVTFQPPTRTNDQNALMWALLTEVAVQVPWHGLRLSADDWKLIFMQALNSEMRIVPNLDGTGFVNLGTRTSKLTKAEMSDLIELILAFAAQHDVKTIEDVNP